MTDPDTVNLGDPASVQRWIQEVDEFLEAHRPPDITDAHGRVWTWWKGDLYRHEGKAWPRTFIPLPESEQQ